MSLDVTPKIESVLISGGSVAGPATAWWLNRYGFKTTIVERWPELRPGGQNVDVRDFGRVALDAMGLTSAVLARNTGEKGTRFLDAKGNIKADIPAGPNSPTSDLEILRGDIGQLLYDETKEETEWLFGDHIVAFEEKQDGVLVEFKSGKKRQFDQVVIADGIGSRTRQLAFASEAVRIRHLGLYTAYFSSSKDESNPNYEHWQIVHLPHRRVISVRPDPYGTSRTGISFISSTSLGYEKLPMSFQKPLLIAKFPDSDVYSQYVRRGLEETNDLYVEYLGQVFAKNWSTPGGRVAMVGDAAYCASPLSGVGTSLALVGAYVLAGELAKYPEEPKVAMTRYQEVVSQFVNKSQSLPPGVPGIAHPESVWGIRVLHGVVAVVALAARVWSMLGLGWIWGKVAPASRKYVLPDYLKHWADHTVKRFFLAGDTSRNAQLPGPVDSLITSWSLDPFSRGSYTYTRLANTQNESPRPPIDLSDFTVPIWTRGWVVQTSTPFRIGMQGAWGV
ncbi:hypothetical protein P7C73_g3982, partial [Tremellales sp. Uapishka_1]